MSNPASMRTAIEMRVKKEYAQTQLNEDNKIIDGIQKFILMAQQHQSLRPVLKDAAITIFRLFPFKEITIGLKSPKDGLYRYEEILGHSKSAEQAHRSLAYTYEEFFDSKDYPAIRLSKYTEFALLEEQPFLENEKDTYNRPIMLTGVRKTVYNFVEGDYFDIYMYSPSDEMIGWIELGATKDGNIPSMITIKWLEFFASILSLLVQKHSY